MSTVEVLAPLRLETRFVPPTQRTDGVNEWMLRLRVYPDEFSIRRRVAPPTSEELDRLEESVAKLTATPPWKEADAFASFAASVGAARALRLWRQHVVASGAGLTVNRTGGATHEPFSVHGPAGLPAKLEVWFVHTSGTRTLVTTLAPDVVEIGNDLDIKTVFEDLPDRERQTARHLVAVVCARQGCRSGRRYRHRPHTGLPRRAGRRRHWRNRCGGTG